jgi:sugar/nucleoside kinase (ribokinase family)
VGGTAGPPDGAAGLVGGTAGPPGGAAGLVGERGTGPAVVAQSHGAGPIEVFTAAGRVAVPVPAVEAVDTLGAGDVLHGAFVAWLASGTASEAASGTAFGRASRPGAADGPSAVSTDPTAPALLLAGLTWAASVASASCTARGARGWAADATSLARWRRELKNPAGSAGA